MWEQTAAAPIVYDQNEPYDPTHGGVRVGGGHTTSTSRNWRASL